jgi:hypothetical protein
VPSPFGSDRRNSVARNITTGPVEMRSPNSENRWHHDSTASAIAESAALVGILILAWPQVSSMTFAVGRTANFAASRSRPRLALMVTELDAWPRR